MGSQPSEFVIYIRSQPVCIVDYLHHPKSDHIPINLFLGFTNGQKKVLSQSKRFCSDQVPLERLQ